MYSGNIEFSRYLTNENFPQNFHIIANKRTVTKPFPLHWHEYFEIELILSGRAKASYNGTEYDIKTGSICILSPTDFHSFEVVEEEIRLININFDDSIVAGNLLYPLFYTNQNMYFDLSEDSYQSALFYARKLVFENGSSEPMKDRNMNNLLDCLLIEIIRHSAPKIAETEPKEPLLKALAFIHEQFREDPTLSKAAEKSGYCINYFCDAFKQTTGKTYKEYLNALKLDYAKKLILSTSSTVTETCFSCGFNTLSHFLREFKRYHGMSPKELKQRYSCSGVKEGVYSVIALR